MINDPNNCPRDHKNQTHHNDHHQNHTLKLQTSPISLTDL